MLAKEARVTVAYNQDDLRMEVDEDSVTLYLYDIKRIEMTRCEFEKLMEAYDDLAVQKKEA